MAQFLQCVKKKSQTHSTLGTKHCWKAIWSEALVPVGGGPGLAVLEVKPPGGQWLTVSMLPSDLTKPDRAAEKIVNATVSPGDVSGLKSLLAKIAKGQPKKRIMVTERGGFHGDFFVVGHRTIRMSKTTSKTKVVFDAARASRNPPLDCLGKRGGTLDGWQTGVCAPAAYSSIGVAVIAVGFAAPLLHLSGLPGGCIYNATGKSSGGKTTLTLAGMSVQGLADRKGMVPPGLTARALEETGAAFNDLMCPFDDLSRLESAALRKVCKTLTYQFCDGGGKQVADIAMQAGLKFYHFNSIGLISSEISSTEIAKLAGETRQAGERARLFDLTTDGDKGVFDLLPPDGSVIAKDVAIGIEQAARDNYGHALPAFLKWMATQDRTQLVGNLKRLIGEFAVVAAGGAGPVQRRAADKFGLLYAALVLAADAGVILWSEKLFRAALLKCYRLAVSDRAVAGSTASLLQRLHDLLKEPGRVLTATAAGKVASRTGRSMAGRQRHGREETAHIGRS